MQTDSRYGDYLSYYMKDFVVGENPSSDGMLLDRMKRKPDSSGGGPNGLPASVS